MTYRIRSIIEIHHGGVDDMKDEKEIEQKGVESEEKSDGSLSSSSEKKSHKYRSEAVSDRNRMFHSVRQRHGGINQKVKVEVNIEQQSDQCLNGCFKAITSCFRR